ncbi:PREDICTED: podocalyxin [Bison bison bison]|uniref:Podocalyxin n=1 Tax=Bison bison bison TaxID=43346 RepID=A0A6P3GUH6_BISBB|nr:PREDICTED: podocalyxin [Bison bison bison]
MRAEGQQTQERSPEGDRPGWERLDHKPAEGCALLFVFLLVKSYTFFKTLFPPHKPFLTSPALPRGGTREQPLRPLLPGATRGALTLHQPGPSPPPENAAGGKREGISGFSTIPDSPECGPCLQGTEGTTPFSVHGQEENVTGTTEEQTSPVKSTVQLVASTTTSEQTLSSNPDKQNSALTPIETSTVTTAPASTVVLASAQKSPTATANETTLVTTEDPTTTSTTVSTSPESTSSRNAMNDSPTSRIPTTHSVTTDSMTAKEGSQKISTSPDPNIIPSISPILSSSTNLSSTQQPSPGPVTSAPGTSEPTGSFPEGSDKMTVTTSLGRMTSPTFTARVTTLKTQVAVEGTQHTSSETPAVTVTTGVQQPTGSSQGRGTTSLVRRSTISSTQLTSNAPQSSSTPSPTSVILTNIGQIQCHPPEKLNESKLSLNISGANSCNTVASNHRLVEVLCQAVKSSFNKTQDECHIEMAPGSHAQEVDIKQITIITKLQPTDIYKLLKNDWDKLEGVGVRDMQFGGQGPPEEMEDRFSMPLIITIVCMASFLLLVAALYGCCHQRLSHRKDQQRLTEELQTVENGYHDNPTLEVMETSSEMQEKKVANLNGELGDSWIVPLDNLTKDDPEEEDTHL